MFQEAGNQGDDGPQLNNIGIEQKIYYGHEFSAYFYGQAGARNARCTTGMFVENGFDDVHVDSIDRLCARPVVYCRCSFMHPTRKVRKNFVFATAHMTAEHHVAAQEMSRVYNHFNANFPNGNWLVIGDFNCPPNLVPPPVDKRIKWGPKTHGKNILDFVMCSESLDDYITVNLAKEGEYVPLGSDHYPIKCEIRDDFFNI